MIAYIYACEPLSLSLLSSFLPFLPPFITVQKDGTNGGMSVWPGGAGPLLYQDWCQCQYGRFCKLYVCPPVRNVSWI